MRGEAILGVDEEHEVRHRDRAPPVSNCVAYKILKRFPLRMGGGFELSTVCTSRLRTPVVMRWRSSGGPPRLS